MKDGDCVSFLQWCLPRIGMRWAGFRRVRRQVCKRIGRRIRALGLADVDAYRAYLAAHPEEWAVVDAFCRITISRFFRDRQLFEILAERVLPEMAERAAFERRVEIRCWSAGCASGEEPYSLSIAWRMLAGRRFPGVHLAIIATDADAGLLARARAGRYRAGSLKEVPAAGLEAAFERAGDAYRIRPAFRGGIAFERQDIRFAMPDGPFDLVLCRNLAFTYFDSATQRRVLDGIARRTVAGGILMIGGHETLPENEQFVALADCRQIWRKGPGGTAQRA